MQAELLRIYADVAPLVGGFSEVPSRGLHKLLPSLEMVLACDLAVSHDYKFVLQGLGPWAEYPI